MNDVETSIIADECTTSQFSILNEVDEDGNEKANTKQKKNNKKKKNKNQHPGEGESVKPTTSKKSMQKGHLLGEINDQNDSQAIFRYDVSKCLHCDKMILKVSFQMHEMHCSRVNAAKAQELNKPKDEPAKPKSAAAKSKVKKNPIETAKTDDFDELLEMFQKSNDICNFKGCKVLTKTLGQNCEYCPNRFCLKHSMAEVHGCGDAAKKQARDHIRKDGNLDVRKKQSYSAEVKHKVVEKKLHEKIKTMQEARTGSKSKKDGK